MIESPTMFITHAASTECGEGIEAYDSDRKKMTTNQLTGDVQLSGTCGAFLTRNATY